MHPYALGQRHDFTYKRMDNRIHGSRDMSSKGCGRDELKFDKTKMREKSLGRPRTSENHPRRLRERGPQDLGEAGAAYCETPMVMDKSFPLDRALLDLELERKLICQDERDAWQRKWGRTFLGKMPPYVFDRLRSFQHTCVAMIEGKHTERTTLAALEWLVTSLKSLAADYETECEVGEMECANLSRLLEAAAAPGAAAADGDAADMLVIAEEYDKARERCNEFISMFNQTVEILSRLDEMQGKLVRRNELFTRAQEKAYDTGRALHRQVLANIVAVHPATPSAIADTRVLKPALDAADLCFIDSAFGLLCNTSPSSLLSSPEAVEAFRQSYADEYAYPPKSGLPSQCPQFPENVQTLAQEEERRMAAVAGYEEARLEMTHIGGKLIEQSTRLCQAKLLSHLRFILQTNEMNHEMVHETNDETGLRNEAAQEMLFEWQQMLELTVGFSFHYNRVRALRADHDKICYRISNTPTPNLPCDSIAGMGESSSSERTVLFSDQTNLMACRAQLAEASSLFDDFLHRKHDALLRLHFAASHGFSTAAMARAQRPADPSVAFFLNAFMPRSKTSAAVDGHGDRSAKLNDAPLSTTAADPVAGASLRDFELPHEGQLERAVAAFQQNPQQDGSSSLPL